MRRIITILMVLSCVYSISAFARKNIKHDTATTMTGRIVKENFVHGKAVEGVYDYFFQYHDKKYFIKEYGSMYTKDSLDKWIGKLVEIKAVVKNGEWDSTREPEKQESRVGEYITILKIELFTP